MEIKVGIQQVAREAILNIDTTIDEIIADFRAARAEDGLLTLRDTSGRQMMIPALSIGYIEFGQEHARPVGFGA